MTETIGLRSGIFVVSLLGAMASAASAHGPSVRAVRVAGRYPSKPC